MGGSRNKRNTDLSIWSLLFMSLSAVVGCSIRCKKNTLKKSLARKFLFFGWSSFFRGCDVWFVAWFSGFLSGRRTGYHPQLKLGQFDEQFQGIVVHLQIFVGLDSSVCCETQVW